MTSLLVQPCRVPLAGYAKVPGDKSVSHRAVVLAALADGPVAVRGLGEGLDNHRTLGIIEALGVAVERTPAGRLIHGRGVDGLLAPARDLDCGNSGTAMRLLAGLLAAQRFPSRLCGDASLSSRPMRRVVDPLASMGAPIEGRAGAEPGEVYPPLQLAGRGGRDALRAIDYRLPIASAQVKSALLLAACYGDGRTRLTEPGPSRDHTERMLTYLGAPLQVEDPLTVSLDPSRWDRRLEPKPLTIPGDPSSAAFLVVAALIAGAEPRVTVADVCVNPTRTGFLEVLAQMGARVEQHPSRAAAAEPTADLVVARGAGDALGGAVIAGDLMVRAIDEIPILAIAAARGRGETDFRDAAELRVKESDRIAAIASMLRHLGVEVQERDDGFTVAGRGRAPFRSARIDSRGDHRIAMAAVVAALAADGPVRIDDVDNVATSYPAFAETMVQLGADIRVEG